MKFKNLFCGLAAVVFLSLQIFAQTSGYRISAPVSYKNLSVFLIHGKDEIKSKNILTLQEAMEKDLFVVYETSDVNELMVENKSSQYEVFIQSGDIVKGGKQDRVLAITIIIPAKFRFKRSVLNQVAGRNAVTKNQGNFLLQMTGLSAEI